MSVYAQKLLIYIPAHFDFESAIAQAQLILRERERVDLDIQVVISINAVDLTNESHLKIKNSCDDFVFLSENLGGDTNINLGYLKALSVQADYLWILSANDLLIPGSIEKISSAVGLSSKDMLVICSDKLEKTGFINNAFINGAANLPIGLISAVIFHVPRFGESFASALKYAWTGWGQLSVIQNSIFEHETITYDTVDEVLIYNRETQCSYESDLKSNQSKYRHSFFGYPLVVALLFADREKLRNQIIRNWLKSNWYKIGYFNQGHSPYSEEGFTTKDVFWTGPLSKQFIVKSGPMSPLLYFIGSLGLIFRLKDNNLLIMAKQRFVSNRRSQAR
jgi:hypothetical protein